MLDVAKLFDLAHGNDQHSKVVKQQMEKLHNPALTPSAQVMRSLQQRDQSFYEFAVECAQDHKKHFMNQPLSSESVTPSRVTRVNKDITFITGHNG